MTSTQRVWLTQHAHDRLRAELDALLAPPAPRVADTHDEPAHHQRDLRIRQIQDVLNSAAVGQDPPDDGIVEPGMVLTVRYDDTGETETFLLGARDAEQDASEIPVYSPTSPLGTILSGARRGEQRSYRVPNGDTVPVTLLGAVPYAHRRTQDIPPNA